MRLAYLLALLLTTACQAAGPSLLIRGATIHPVSSPKIENANLLVVDGKIAEIGPKVSPPKGARLIDARGLHVYPGMIDSATEVGLSEISSVRETNDTTELGDFKPQLRTVIAVNADSEHIPVIRANGIVAAITLPQGGVISGQAAFLYLDGWTWEEMAIRRDVAMVLHFPTFGAGPSRFSAETPPSLAEMRRTYENRVKQLQDYLEQARAYQRAKAAPSPEFRPNLAMEAMLPVIEGKLPLLIHASRERSIRDALSWAQKEKVRVILAGVRKPGNTLAEIKAQGIAVILGPTQALPLEEDDAYDEVYSLPGVLYQAGIKFAFGSFGNQFARNLPYQAASAVAFGLPYEEALKSVTLYPAQIWGVDSMMGSLEKGKWANLILTDGDPLEVKTQVKRMFIQGREVELESKHTRLYQRYSGRP
ncbi:MAG: amidohydrolase family protein [Bryobacteraceae bacterium]|nr:amidohydrolase family protein [Bryobacteraceae bacterium]MDW8378629.1 amidohydrolase family protein [Bryobacterales bacterium]